MPGVINASESLLDAIFLNTNKLHWTDRQLILRFLGGEEQQVDDDVPVRPGNIRTGQVTQILLHEDRRNEMRPSNRANAFDPNGEVPTTEMKSYTIVDQIIFEMDYSSGCWRKLRRRIRISDKRNRTASSLRRSNNVTTSRSRRQDENGNLVAVDQEQYVDLLDVSTNAIASEFITQNSSVQTGQTAASRVRDAYAANAIDVGLQMPVVNSTRL